MTQSPPPPAQPGDEPPARRQGDRRRVDLPVAAERRQGDRRVRIPGLDGLLRAVFNRR